MIALMVMGITQNRRCY